MIESPTPCRPGRTRHEAGLQPAGPSYVAVDGEPDVQQWVSGAADVVQVAVPLVVAGGDAVVIVGVAYVVVRCCVVMRGAW